MQAAWQASAYLSIIYVIKNKEVVKLLIRKLTHLKRKENVRGILANNYVNNLYIKIDSKKSKK